MKGYKKNGKFIPTTKKKKSALKIADIPQERKKIDEDYETKERAEWDWIHRKN